MKNWAETYERKAYLVLGCLELLNGYSNWYFMAILFSKLNKFEFHLNGEFYSQKGPSDIFFYHLKHIWASKCMQGPRKISQVKKRGTVAGIWWDYTIHMLKRRQQMFFVSTAPTNHFASIYFHLITHYYSHHHDDHL